MRNAMVLPMLLLLADTDLAGQGRIVVHPARPAAGRPGPARNGAAGRVVPAGPRMARPHGYGIWPFGGWWGGGYEQPQTPAPSQVEKVKETPALVINKEFVREKLTPQSTEYAEGALPATKLTPSVEGMKDRCTVKFRDGEVVQGRSCGLRDDTLEFVTEAGRRTRVSLDLVAGY